MKLKKIVRNPDQSWSIELPDGTLYPAGTEHQKWDDLQDAQRAFGELLDAPEMTAGETPAPPAPAEGRRSKKEAVNG